MKWPRLHLSAAHVDPGVKGGAPNRITWMQVAPTVEKMDPKRTAKFKGSNRSEMPADASFPTAVTTPIVNAGSIKMGPGVTTTQKNAITGMVEGDMVFDKTLHALCFYNGSAWRTVTNS